MKAVLEPFNNRPHRIPPYLDIPRFLAEGKIPRVFSGMYHAHSKASLIKAQMPKSIFDNYYKFGFVRNPWDRQVSIYHYILREKGHQHYDAVSKLSGFEEYLEWRIDLEPANQKILLYDEKGENLLVDFVGRFENLEADFRIVCDAIGLDDIELPHKNKSKHKPYQEYYNDHTRALIEKYWKDDIDTFGYTFD